MKKSLVLAMAMALGVTASAYAANPFSDVPAGHWAYDAVNELAAAGVVEGYGDGTYAGDKLITRYEMAQIVAKAMAKGADCDKLAAEFASELDTLGVRVAALEKKADNVKITGEVRARYMDQGYKVNGNVGYEADLRSRLWLEGSINEDWSYTGMIENTQDLSDNSGNDSTELQRAFVKGKLGGMEVTAGRYDAFFAEGAIYDDNADGVEVSYGEKVTLTGYYGRGNDAPDYYGAKLSGSVLGVDLSAGYYEFDEIGSADRKLAAITAAKEIGSVGLSAVYVKANKAHEDANGKRDGWMLGATYKGADAEEAGSWGLFANYYNQAVGTYVAHTTDANTFDSSFKGYGVGVNYALAKNIVATVAYFDTEDKLGTDDDQRLWTDVTFTF